MSLNSNFNDLNLVNNYENFNINVFKVLNQNDSLSDSNKKTDSVGIRDLLNECKWQSFYSLKGRIKLERGTDRLERKVIYIIRNKLDGKSYIGKTDRTFRERIREHLAKFNSQDGVVSEITADLKKAPSDFETAILYVIREGENSDEVEDQMLQAYSSMGYSLYNRRRGGGGGSSVDAELPSHYAISKDGYRSPKKTYSFKRTEKGVRLDLSPGIRKKIEKSRTKARENGCVRGFIYRIKGECDGIDCRYVGYSGIPEKRLLQHGYLADKKENSLYENLSNHPEKFSAGLIPVHFINPLIATEEENENYHFVNYIGEAEKIVISQAKVIGPLFNENNGGGGTIARNLTSLRN